MSVQGIGVDIADVKKSKKIMFSKNAKSFLEKTFTENEIKYINNCPYKLSGVFSVKEAFYKALGTGWVEGKLIEITYTKKGAPKIKLHGKMKNKLKNKKVHCSISHGNSFVVGLVVIEK